jgi:hypothetical protein
MAKIDLATLAAQVEQLQAVLKAHGIQAPTQILPMEERPDYVPHGSLAHATLLGLVEVAKDEQVITLATYTSPRSSRVFRLEDEMGAIQFYPGIDPEKACRLVLQQKVNELETKPTVPDDAPAMFQPVAVL